MAYLSEPLLVSAWTDLKDRVGNLNIPLQLWRSAQNPAASFERAYGTWWDRLGAKYDERGKLVRPFTVYELEQWSAALAEQQLLVGKLEAAYPQRKPDETSGKRGGPLPEQLILGALPWWYWPLRVGAGIGGGYFLYKVLRPTEGSFQPALAGLGAATNAEGMTYSEWRAAAVGGGKRPENDPLDAADRRALKKAWKEGEDPSDWRKYFSDRSYAREMERVK